MEKHIKKHLEDVKKIIENTNLTEEQSFKVCNKLLDVEDYINHL